MNIIKIPINNKLIVAFYGYDNNTIDILELTKKHMNNLLKYTISNKTFKEDPYPDMKKYAVFIFESGDKYIINENDIVEFIKI
jgi:hypothetical protein